MPDISSSFASADAHAFFPVLMSDQKRLAAFRRIIRGHPTMAWANARCLGDDLEQIALIEVAAILKTYDPSRGTTVEQFIGVALRRRMYSAYASLANAYFDDGAGSEENFPRPENEADAREEVVDLHMVPYDYDAGSTHDKHHDQSRAASGKDAYYDLATDNIDDRVLPDWWWLYDSSRRLALDPAVAIESTRNSNFLATQIELLPVRQRDVLELLLSGQTNREIACSLGVSVQSVGQTRCAALIKLTAAASGSETIH